MSDNNFELLSRNDLRLKHLSELATVRSHIDWMMKQLNLVFEGENFDKEKWNDIVGGKETPLSALTKLNNALTKIIPIEQKLKDSIPDRDDGIDSEEDAAIISNFKKSIVDETLLKLKQENRLVE